MILFGDQTDDFSSLTGFPRQSCNNNISAGAWIRRIGIQRVR